MTSTITDEKEILQFIDPLMYKIKESATLKINKYVKEAKKNGEIIYNFGLGESPFASAHRYQIALTQEIHRKSYSNSSGIDDLKQQIKDFYEHFFQITVDTNQIVVGPGSKYLIYLTMLIFDADWIILRPSWVSYEHQLHIAKRKMWELNLDLTEDYKLSVERLLAQIKFIRSQTQRRLILLLNYPNNPTGITYSKVEVEEIAKVCKQHNIIVASDEIYGNLTHHDKDHYSIQRAYPEGTIVTGGVSKDRSLGGWRIGVGILPTSSLLPVYESILSETTSCLPDPIQHAVKTVFIPDVYNEMLIQKKAAIHSWICQYVYEKLTSAGYEVVKPEGAYYLFPSLNHLGSKLNSMEIMNSADLCHYMLDEYNIAALPGSDFGLDKYNLSFRLAIVDYDAEGLLQIYNQNLKIANFMETYCKRLMEGTEALVTMILDLKD